MGNERADIEQEVAEASDIEQRLGHGGNARDAGAGAERTLGQLENVAGSSGHVPL